MQHVTGPRAEREPDADLPPPLADERREHAVDPDRAQRQPDEPNAPSSTVSSRGRASARPTARRT